MRRFVITVIGAFLAVPAAAQPAAAAERLSGSNYLSSLLSVHPHLPGVELRVIETGNRVRLVNRSQTDVVVLGYEGEPYLQVGPSGLFENRRSPATYLNRDRKGLAPVPPEADPTAPPDWREVSSAREAAWYDHRVHWMGAIHPPAVRRAPDERHVIYPDWRIPFRAGGVQFEAVGELVWVPGPNPAPWLLLAALPLGAAAVVAGGALWLRRRSWWWGPLAVGLALLVTVDVVAAASRTWDSPGSVGDRLVRALSSHPWQAAAWLVGLAGIGSLIRRRRRGLYASAAAGVGVLVFGGILASADLARSQIPSVLPVGAARATIAWAIGMGAAVVVGSLAALKGVRDLGELGRSVPASGG